MIIDIQNDIFQINDDLNDHKIYLKKTLPLFYSKNLIPINHKFILLDLCDSFILFIQEEIIEYLEEKRKPDIDQDLIDLELVDIYNYFISFIIELKVYKNLIKNLNEVVDKEEIYYIRKEIISNIKFKEKKNPFIYKDFQIDECQQLFKIIEDILEIRKIFPLRKYHKNNPNEYEMINFNKLELNLIENKILISLNNLINYINFNYDIDSFNEKIKEKRTIIMKL